MSDRMPVPVVQDLGDVLLLDTGHLGRPGTIGVYLLPLSGGAFALVETGPASTAQNVERAIGEAGFELSALEHILVTHIHLDHAGAAGALARKSGALVHVHHRGAKHLEDPSRLLESATRVYGDELEALWGRMEPVPGDQLRAVFDGDRVRLPGRRVEALDTPGHAGHHLSFLLDDETLFTGDSAAIRFPPCKLIRPAVPPPETDLEAWEASIAKMRATVPERLLLTHFGQVDDADEHLASVPERNQAWANEALAGLRQGEDTNQLERRMANLQESEFEAHGVSEEFKARYRATSDAAMTAMGLSRYWRKHHPDALEET